MSTSLVEAARAYAQLDYRVFPCVPNGKKPLTTHGLNDATCDLDQIERWWIEHPNANIGLCTEGLVVIDVDGKDNPWLGELDERWQDLAYCPSATTPRGGRHYVFRQPAGKAWRCSQGKLAPNVDVRANGGYIVVAPSTTADGSYQWCQTLELKQPREQLPEPPQWLIDDLDRISRPAPPAPPPPGSKRPFTDIPTGQRNGTLTSLAGNMRRAGMTADEMDAGLQRVNINRCKPPLDPTEVTRIAESVSRYESHPTTKIMAVLSVSELRMSHPELRRPVIHGLVREGETLNIIAPPKTGKSWLVTDLALAVTTGRRWLDSFQTEKGNVLIIDNELHGETSANRIPRVAEARSIDWNLYESNLHISNLRGQLVDLYGLEGLFRALANGQYKLIILDAFYRFLPAKTDENDNGSIAALYNFLDFWADKLGCAFAIIHHASKGNQSAKSITDVGAGAGAQSRATDTHLILRQHLCDHVVVLEATTRSWPPPAPMCLKWQFPVWVLAPDLDPTDLRREKTRTRKPREETPKEPKWTVARFVETFVGPDPLDQEVILARASVGHDLSEREAKRLLILAEADKLIHRWPRDKDKRVYFANREMPLTATDQN